MRENVKYSYDSKLKILTKKYLGDINIELLRNSWVWAFEDNIIPSKTKRFVLDYSEAVMKITVKESSEIADFYKDHLKYFKGAKFALLTNTPHNVVISTLLYRSSDGYISKPFSTYEAAINWLKL